MLVLTAGSSFELTVKGSRFLAESFCVTSQAEAREKLREQKERYADATHVVHAFITGDNAELSGMSDDGEPGGTAGRPVLDVLKGSGITNILLTVTRWFGGTLLGTGGLVRAYSDAAKGALDLCRTEELVRKSGFSFKADYAEYQTIKHQIEGLNLSGVKEIFGSEVTVSGEVPLTQADALMQKVQNATRGRVNVAFIA